MFVLCRTLFCAFAVQNIMIHRDGHVVLCDFGFAKAQIPETDRGTLSFCPAVGTLVALAPSASSLLGGDDVAVQSRVLPIECIKPGMQLVGSRGPVTVLAMSPPQSTDVMYNITLADGFAYKVTSDHLVTLRWASAPFIQINSGSSTPQHPELPPNSSEDTLAVVFFTCMDGKLQQCSLPFVHTDTDFQLQQQLRETAMWAQFEAEAAKPGTEASYALRHGMMFEMVRAQHLFLHPARR
jgi:serine/threonine protein kinase